MEIWEPVKTAFTKGIAKALGIEETVTSPTYNLYLIYEGNRQLIHLDAYRLNSAAEMDGLMLEDIMKSPYCLIVEWAKNVTEWFDDRLWTVDITIEADHRRRFRLSDVDRRV